MGEFLIGIAEEQKRVKSKIVPVLTHVLSFEDVSDA
jgi:hypothetical protein